MINQHNQRVFYSDNGLLEDITLRINDFRTGTFGLGGYTAGEDYIFIGTDLPFANRYIDLTSFNSETASIAIDLWDGNDWKPAIDLLDETAVPGQVLAQNGVVSWKLDKDENWNSENDSFDVTGLTGTEIYCFYWLRMSFSAALSAGTTLNHLGYLFNNDDELYSYYPDLKNTRMLDAFERGSPTGTKTSWKEQSLMAANQIIKQMRSSAIVWTPNQILNFEILKEASIHKTAEIIYSAFGEPYEAMRKIVQEKYAKAFNMKKFEVDWNKDTRLSAREKNISTGFMTR